MKTKSIVVIAVMSVLVIVFAVSGVLLFRGISQFSKEEKVLKRSVSTLRNYYARNPFPSAENVEREEKNGQALRQWMADLSSALRSGQVEPIQKTPAQFLRLFSQKRENLKQVARRNKTKLDGDFDMGFERYAASGSLPAPADVPRLAQQLIIADHICQTLFKNGAAELIELRREEFESAGASATASDAARSTSRRAVRRTRRSVGTTSAGSGDEGLREWTVSPDAGVLGENALFARMRFGVTFEAKEAALLSIMNALAEHDMFAVVSFLKIEKTADDVLPPPVAAKSVDEAQDSDAAKPPPRSKRLMSGQMLEQPMLITMEIDVYRFAELTSGKGA